VFYHYTTQFASLATVVCVSRSRVGFIADSAAGVTKSIVVDFRLLARFGTLPARHVVAATRYVVRRVSSMLSLRPVVVRGGKVRMTPQGEFMTFRFTPKTVFGAAAMLTLGAALATAQDTSKAKPRSDRRLPISKEAAGEVVREVVRTDTVMVYRTDTVERIRRDTVRLTRTRIDTVIPRLPAYRYPAGFFAGAAGGFSTPSGSLYTPNSTGGAAQIQLGWLNAKQVIGGRLDWNGAWPGQDSRFSRLQGQASIQNFSADLKLQWPFNFGGDRYKYKPDPCEGPMTYTRGPFHRFAIYGLGGFTYTTYRNLPMRINTPDVFTNGTIISGDSVIVVNPGTVVPGTIINGQNVAFFVPGEDNWHSRGGWNAGGGLSMFWGHTELFVEARVIGFKPRSVDINNFTINNVNGVNTVNFSAPQARQVPVVLGVNWY
jgi:hypothetical protein